MHNTYNIRQVKINSFEIYNNTKKKNRINIAKTITNGYNIKKLAVTRKRSMAFCGANISSDIDLGHRCQTVWWLWPRKNNDRQYKCRWMSHWQTKRRNRCFIAVINQTGGRRAKKGIDGCQPSFIVTGIYPGPQYTHHKYIPLSGAIFD